MALRTLIGSLFGIACLVACPVASASLVSTFDSGADGWSVNSDEPAAGVAGFGWTAHDGNPGGSVQARDTGLGGWWFVAPAAWVGDWSGYLGGGISFDVFATPGTSTTPNPPVPAVVLVLADGGNLRAVTGAGAVQGQWVAAEIELTADNFTLTNSSYSTFAEALAHVSGFVIPGDFVFQQQDVTRLDNVRVSAVPEPATWALALGGLIAALWSRRSHRRMSARRCGESTHLEGVS